MKAPLVTSKRRGLVALALFGTYVVWGSTYLALRYGLEDGFPPFILNGIRLVVAGGGLYLVLRARGYAAPTRRQWWNLTRIGALLMVGGLGLVAIAEDLGVGSGLAATAIAVMPLWAALFGGLFGKWPNRVEWIGLLIGFAGVAMLAQEGDFQSTATGAILVMIAPMSWAFGSVWGGRLDLPGTWMTTAGELFAGGVLLLIIGPLRGERIVEAPSLSAWLALGYLIVFGSLVAFTAYVYLLDHVRPALATSYAFVNPVVAVVLGVTLGGEKLTGPAFIALPLIVVGVALVVLAHNLLSLRERWAGSEAAGSERVSRPGPTPAKSLDSLRP